MNIYNRIFYSLAFSALFTVVANIILVFIYPITDMEYLLLFISSYLLIFIYYGRYIIKVKEDRIIFPLYFGLAYQEVKINEISKILFMYKHSRRDKKRGRTNFGKRSFKFVFKDKTSVIYLEYHFKRIHIAHMTDYIKEINKEVHINKLMLHNIEIYKRLSNK